MIRKISIVLFAIMATPVCAAPVLIAAYNETSQPVPNSSYAFYSIGWLWKAPISFELTRIETFFGSNDKTVGIEVYDGHPDSGGVLIASANYSEVGGTWGGADIGPVSLSAGNEYLIGFTNVEQLGPSFTEDLGSSLFSTDGLIHYDSDTAPPASYVQHSNGQANAMIRIFGVPEPSSILLTVSAFAALPTRHRKSVDHNRV